MMCVEVYEKKVPGKGKGIYAGKFIPKGTLVWKLKDYKKFTKKEFQKLPKEIQKDAYPQGDFYILATGDGESWNHCCDANTWWTADDELSAKRDIQKDEEITYDYATTDIDPDITYDWICKCRSKVCRKKLHWNDILIPEVYKRYEGHIPSWVEKFVQNNRKK